MPLYNDHEPLIRVIMENRTFNIFPVVHFLWKYQIFKFANVLSISLIIMDSLENNFLMFLIFLKKRISTDI